MTAGSKRRSSHGLRPAPPLRTNQAPAARALLGRASAVLAARGEHSVIAEADDADSVSVALLTRLGARRYGGSVELIRRQAAIVAAD